MDSNQTYEINETEKARILAEEKYREEIRADLAKLRTPSTRRQRLWNFLNTSLGIWLLSSIVLGESVRNFVCEPGERISHWE